MKPSSLSTNESQETHLWTFKVLQPVRDTFFKKQQPEQALAELLPILTQLQAATPHNPLQKSIYQASYELAGYIALSLGHYAQAEEYFQTVNNHFFAGYVRMLESDLPRCGHHWRELVHQRPNHWAFSLFGLITAQLAAYPTFFQVRNHLETDIWHLAKAQQWTFLNNVLGHIALLAQVNIEAYKYAGRGLFNADVRDPVVLNLLLSAQKHCPQDPEVYYHLAQYYDWAEDVEKARLMLKQCLMMNPTYTPASALLDRLLPL